MAAINTGHDPAEGVVRTERDRSVPEASAPYPKSTTLAELAAWDVVAGLPDDGRRFDLTVPNPGMVLGPLRRPDVRTSVELVRRLLTGAVPGSAPVGFAIVDVRDVAIAHRLAMETPGAAGRRSGCAGESLWMHDIAEVLARHFGPLGHRVPTRRIPAWAVRLIGRFDPAVRTLETFLGRAERVSHERARAELRWSPRPAETTIVDTANSLIEHGLVGPRRGRTQSAVAS